jgi:hypothetical protein
LCGPYTRAMFADTQAPEQLHARALLLRGRCPACAEPLGPRSLFGEQPCGRCAGVIAQGRAGPGGPGGGAGLADALAARGRRHLIGIVIAVAVAQLLLGWLPLVGALALIGAAVWIRVGILQPTSALLSPRRRVLTRWTARLVMATALAAVVIAIEALTLLPVLGLPVKAVIGAAEVALAAAAVTAYVHWQLRREAQGLEVAAWEWAVLIAALASLVAAVVILALAFAALAAALQTLVEGLS